jgi:hypothetical protein
MAATVWDDATRDIATYRLRHGVPADVDGIGPPPSFDTPEHAVWSQVSTRLARTRIWLATHDHQPVVPVGRTRSTVELHRRQGQLEAIFATAPPDHRRLIDQVTSGQLMLDDANQALEEALAAQNERSDWILQHWPHIVEHADITRTLNAGTAGPGVGPLLDQLVSLGTPAISPTDSRSLLADAARTNQVWLRTALSRLVPPDADHVAQPIIELLGDVASYRDRWHITHPAPLGLAADTDEQARELRNITQGFQAALGARTPPTADVSDRMGQEAERTVPELNL